jgi:acyl carrier protein
VKSMDDFVTLVREELGLLVDRGDVGRQLDELPGWDSVHLLQLLTALERTTGRRISLPAVLEAPDLEHIYLLATAS